MSEKNHNGKQIVPNLDKLPITEYYAKLPAAKRILTRKYKQDLLDIVADATCRDESSVRRWFLGLTVPPPIARDKISKILDTPVNILFPNLP